MPEDSSKEARVAAVVDDCDASLRAEILLEAGEVRRARGEMVVGVAREHQVHAGRGQARIVFAREHDFDIGDVLTVGTGAQIIDHGRVDVDGVDLPRGPDHARQSEREVAAPCAEVRYGFSRLDPEHTYDFVWMLPPLAAESFVGKALERAAAEFEGQCQYGEQRHRRILVHGPLLSTP